MKKLGVAILGLGVVGGGTYKILTDNKAVSYTHLTLPTKA